MFPGKLRWRCWQLLQECLRLYPVELLETSFDALVARIDVVIAEHHSFGPMLRNERSCRYRSARLLGRQNASHLVQVNTEDLQQYNYIAVDTAGLYRSDRVPHVSGRHRHGCMHAGSDLTRQAWTLLHIAPMSFLQERRP